MLRPAKAEVNLATTYGSTALHNAANSGNEAGVRLLLAKGAAPNPKIERGETVLHTAVRSREEAVLRLLTEGGQTLGLRTGMERRRWTRRKI